jgi:anti-sigma B factor antagonist
MVVYVKTQELSPGITAMTFTGRLIRGNKWNDIEFVVRERIQQGLRNLVLDFRGLNYIDSAGIGFLAVCIGLMEKAGGRIAIAGATGHVKQLLEMTHLDRAVVVHPDLASAHSALSGPAQA